MLFKIPLAIYCLLMFRALKKWQFKWNCALPCPDLLAFYIWCIWPQFLFFFGAPACAWRRTQKHPRWTEILTLKNTWSVWEAWCSRLTRLLYPPPPPFPVRGPVAPIQQQQNPQHLRRIRVRRAFMCGRCCANGFCEPHYLPRCTRRILRSHTFMLSICRERSTMCVMCVCVPSRVLLYLVRTFNWVELNWYTLSHGMYAFIRTCVMGSMYANMCLKLNGVALTKISYIIGKSRLEFELIKFRVIEV